MIGEMRKYRKIMIAVLIAALLCGCSSGDILDHTGTFFQSYKVKDSSGVTGLQIRFSSQQMGTVEDPEELRKDILAAAAGKEAALVADPGFYTDQTTDTGSSGQEIVNLVNLEEAEDLLHIQFVRPAGLEEQAGKNNYSIIAGTSASILDMESGPLRYGEYFVTISAAMLLDPSASCRRLVYKCGNPLHSTEQIQDGSTVDVIRDHDTDMAYVILIRDHVLEFLSINTSDENTVRLFVSELRD